MCWKFSILTVGMHEQIFGWSIKSTMCFPLQVLYSDVKLESHPANFIDICQIYYDFENYGDIAIDWF